ncbi:hypothetical protein [Paenibacillus sp. NPDC058071]|uniref:hypothetical protein n=1 Tax=Paenibacillus sp. NPDC058071 TaxID=3346326 RepID=UPI0036DD8FDD
MPSRNVAYIEGETRADNIIYALADEITGAGWNGNDGKPVENRWEEVFRQDPDVWVTYSENTRPNIIGVYKHTDGLSYLVYTVTQELSTLLNAPDANGLIPSNIANPAKLKVTGSTTYKDKQGIDRTVNVVGLLIVKVPEGLKIVKQRRKELDQSIVEDLNWNEFEIDGDLPSDMVGWDYFISNGSMNIAIRPISGGPHPYAVPQYKFTERYYTANPVHFYEKTVVLKAVPDDTNGTKSMDSYFVMLKQPKEQFNYFDIRYGKGFSGENLTGNAAETYRRACKADTVKPNAVPVIISQLEAEAAYKRQQVGTGFVGPHEKWEIDIDGVTEIKSPPAHYHFGADSVVSWVPYKKRRPDYYVSYHLSISNSRIAIVLEGDPSPDMDGYYRSFAYIGRITPINDHDNPNNFALTVGMGDLTAPKTGFVVADIKQDTNPTYAGWGRYTSNGMYSVSMMATRANVFFQAHYPAFITELPNYPSIGTLPPELSKLLVERNGYQMSNWTEKYHGSPIYLAHQYEGYRGHMDSVVAVNDHNLINLDELVVDTEEPKPGGGTWTEVYKFFSLNTPVSMFDLSANPNGMTVAILKEVK